MRRDIDAAKNSVGDRRYQESKVISEAMMQNDSSWHLDKKIPVSLILALILQSSAMVWWVAKTEARITTIEAGGVSSRWVAEVDILIDSLEAEMSSRVDRQTLRFHVDRLEEDINRLEEDIEKINKK